MKLHRGLAFAVIALVQRARTNVPANSTFVKPADVKYCPFDVKASFAPDLSSLDITYAVSNGQNRLFVQEKFSCYVRLMFNYEPRQNAVSVREIEYHSDDDSSGGEGQIETKIAWDRNFAPVGRS